MQRITVSLGMRMDDTVFKRMNERDIAVEQVLEGIQNAAAAGFEHIKVNMVVQKGVNDHEVLAMATNFRHSGQIVRFIEYMDVGTT
ncbi:MAG: radical SAM protein, partial [Pseudanabaena sp. CRU_2_10]|nr:radical SAM protein [Pseudanabaena sp. CRU_2_10]